MPIIGGLAHWVVRRALPQGTRCVVTVRSGLGRGLCLLVDPRYEVEYSAGAHERKVLEWLAAHLENGGVLYDIGAHIGFISLTSAKLVGEDGNVFAFEADTENAERITGHVQMNALAQIELVPYAAWSECKTLTFWQSSSLSSRNTGMVQTQLENGNDERNNQH
jgi:hypothetical protein